MYCTFHILSSCTFNCILSSHSSVMLLISCYIYYMHFICIYLSYTFLFHIIYCSYTFHILSSCTFSSCSYNCLYFHRIAVLCFSYHVFYTCHFLLGFMSAYTLEVDMGITYVPVGTITVQDNDLYMYIPEGIITVRDSDHYRYDPNGAAIMIQTGSISSTQTGPQYL